MQFDIIPRSFFELPSRVPSVLEEDWQTFFPSSGLTVSEDDAKVYVEASVPGIDPKDIEVTFDKGVLWVRGQVNEEEEDKKRKFYRKASRSFSYRTLVPSAVDEASEPEVISKDGVVTITFAKVAQSEPKKLPVKVA